LLVPRRQLECRGHADSLGDGMDFSLVWLPSADVPGPRTGRRAARSGRTQSLVSVTLRPDVPSIMPRSTSRMRITVITQQANGSAEHVATGNRPLWSSRTPKPRGSIQGVRLPGGTWACRPYAPQYSQGQGRRTVTCPSVLGTDCRRAVATLQPTDSSRSETTAPAAPRSSTLYEPSPAAGTRKPGGSRLLGSIPDSQAARCLAAIRRAGTYWLNLGHSGNKNRLDLPTPRGHWRGGGGTPCCHGSVTQPVSAPMSRSRGCP
jgi:hypothetical protein